MKFCRVTDGVFPAWCHLHVCSSGHRDFRCNRPKIKGFLEGAGEKSQMGKWRTQSDQLPTPTTFSGYAAWECCSNLRLHPIQLTFILLLLIFYSFILALNFVLYCIVLYCIVSFKLSELKGKKSVQRIFSIFQ